jgi:CubicO group peptidase (beta-lactamase class C family)
MLIVRQGYVVFERYYHDYGPGSYFSVASITKSVLSTLVGIALRDGLLTSLDQPIQSFFPSADTHGLTLRHLLSLTAGWRYHPFAERPKTVSEMLAEPLLTAPGERFQYGETPPHLVSAILSQVADMPAVRFAIHELFQPLGMWQDAAGWRARPNTLNHAGHLPEDGPPWAFDADGVSTGGYGLHLSLRDLARLGLLFASGGRWEDRQLVPLDYLVESGRPQSRGGSPMWMPYGLGWWLPAWHRGQARWAAGFGGQTLYVNPELDVVIAVTCKVDPRAPHDGGIFNRHLLTAVTDWPIG